MMDIHRKFEIVLQDTVKEWKQHKEVKGIFVFGSYVRGTATASSDLDICMIWDGDEAPVQLLVEYKEVLVDMSFVTTKSVQEVFENRTEDAFQIAEIVGRLKNARVYFDTDGMVKKWQVTASGYMWSDAAIESVKEKVEHVLKRAETFSQEDDSPSAIYELRCGLLDLARVVLMKNNIFEIIKPAEVLGELRMLDPMMYQLFLRAFKLKGLDERELMPILEDIEKWVKIGVERFETGSVSGSVTALLTEAQRLYHGSKRLTLNSEYELAVMEMRQAIDILGLVLLELGGRARTEDTSFISDLEKYESEFFEQVLFKHGEYDLMIKAVKRSISEARFIAQRL